MSSPDELRTAAERLLRQISHWAPARFAAPMPSGLTRGDRVHQLAQQLADLTATVEAQPRRPVPRLENDTALPHQITVLVEDIARVSTSDADTLRIATKAVVGTSADLDALA